MERTNEELITELNLLKDKYSELEKKYTEEISELKEKLLFLEGLANSSFDGFLVVNPFGQKILQNNRTIELWKIPEEVANDQSGLKQVNHVMHMTANPQQFIDEVNYLREHPDEKSRDELELIDGTVLDRYSSPVIDSEGKNHGRIWTFHDITERKNFEKQLIQLNADKDRFISILAHDLRNPLHGLMGLSALLGKKAKEYPVEKIEKVAGTLNETAKKMYELLEDTLLWASVKAKKVTFLPSEIIVSEIISEVLEILEPCAKLKNITIKNLVAKNLRIVADVYMLKAIFRNLISNAIKFTYPNGTVEIEAEMLQNKTHFQVKDNGVGISPENIEKLFNFTTIQSTKGTENEIGTGFGLLLCKEFTDKHHGTIWIESILNSGTTVNFTIPDKE